MNTFSKAFRARALLATVLLGILTWCACAQVPTQPPIVMTAAPADATNWTLWIAIGGIALLVGGFFYLKKHGDALTKLTDALHHNTAATGANTQVAAAVPAAAPPPPAAVQVAAMSPAEMQAAIAAAVAAATAAARPAAAPPAAAAVPAGPASPSVTAAAPAAGSVQKAPGLPVDPMPMPPTPGDETPIAWAARTGAVPASELVAFNAFAHQFPATTTYADVLTAYRAQQGTRPGTVVVDVGGQTADQGAYRGTVNPAVMTLGNWAYYQQHALGNRAGDIFDRPPVIGSAAVGPDHRWTQGDLANAEPDPVLIDGSGMSLSKFG